MKPAKVLHRLASLLHDFRARPDWVGEVAEIAIAAFLCAAVVLVLVACFSSYP